MSTRQDEMTINDRAIAAIKHEPVDRIPFFDIGVDPDVAKAVAVIQGSPFGSAEMEQLLESGDPIENAKGQALLECEISRTLFRDNVNFFGCSHPFATEEGPLDYLLDPAQQHLEFSADGQIKNMSDVEKIRFVEHDSVFWDRAKAFVDNKGKFCAGAMLWLGIDPVWHSMGFETFSVALLEEPAVVERFMDRVTDWLAETARGLCEIGFDFVWARDDIAYKTQPFFSPNLYKEHLLPYTRKVAEQISLPWIYHSDGNLIPIIDDLLSQGMNALHPLEPGAMDLDELKAGWGDKISLVGNIDLNTLTLGTPEKTRQEVKSRISQLGQGYGYIVSSGNSISSYCQPQNVKAMSDAVMEFGSYPIECD